MVTQGNSVVAGPKVSKRLKRIRYAYVVLALLSVVCAAIAVEISLAAIRSNNKNFCDLTTSFASPAPVKPLNPVLDPRGERSWVVYNKIVKFNHKIGCDNHKS